MLCNVRLTGTSIATQWEEWTPILRHACLNCSLASSDHIHHAIRETILLRDPRREQWLIGEWRLECFFCMCVCACVRVRFHDGHNVDCLPPDLNNRADLMLEILDWAMTTANSAFLVKGLSFLQPLVLELAWRTPHLSCMLPLSPPFLCVPVMLRPSPMCDTFSRSFFLKRLSCSPFFFPLRVSLWDLLAIHVKQNKQMFCWIDSTSLPNTRSTKFAGWRRCKSVL